MARRLARQLDIVDEAALAVKIHVIGAGGIGSWTALLLAKMGCRNIKVYDFDEVEDHNVASQFYKESQLGMKKVEALRDNIIEQTGIEIETEEDVNEEKYIVDDIVIVAVDSIEERAKLASYFEGKERLTIIDGRMGGLNYEIYHCSHNEYKSTIVEADEVTHEPCTGKAICFNCAIIAGHIANTVKRIVRGEIRDREAVYCDLRHNTCLREKITDI